MKCADPVLCYTKEKGGRLFRHFSLSNDLYRQMAQQVFNCGKCIHCRKKKAFELACRCVLHASMYQENCFLTLTYDEDRKGYHNGFEYSDIQKFKKRLRSYCQRKLGRRIEVFNVHEYGRNGKKHWHLIVFNFSPGDRVLFTFRNSIPYYRSNVLSRLWKHGFHCIGDVSEASAMYQSQYMEKDFKHDYVTSSRKSHSQHSGIGRAFFLENYDQILRLGFVPFGGKKMPLPRYFQKIAHKAYCYFYDPSAFVDSQHRKKVYSWPKGPVTESYKKMADLYIVYRFNRDEYIEQLENEWDDVISHYLTTREKPDFIKSAENTLHDLRKKQKQEKF